MQWGDKSAGYTTTGYGDKYSRSCKYSKTNSYQFLLAGQVLFFIWHTNWAVQSFTRAAVPPDKIEDL